MKLLLFVDSCETSQELKKILYIVFKVSEISSFYLLVELILNSVSGPWLETPDQFMRTQCQEQMRTLIDMWLYLGQQR